MKRTGKKTAGAVAGILFLAACVALYAYIYIVPTVTGALTPTAIAQYGEMLTSNPAKCIVFRSERVITAQQSGNTGYYVEEGAKTRHGVKVADIYPADGSANGYYMDTTALVSYWYDGLEDTFTPDAMDAITLDSFPADDGSEDIPEPEQIRTSSKQKDDPLFKVITDDVWYMALRIEEQYMDRYSMGSTMEVQFETGSVDATITRMTKYEDYWVVVAYTHRYYEDSARLRYCDVTIVTEEDTGLLIPTTARAFQEQEDGEMLEGVYLKTIRGDYVFRRVLVLAEDETTGQSLVAEDSFTVQDEEGNAETVYTIGVYDEILRDAGGLSDVTISDEEEETEAEEEEIVFEWEKTPEEQEETPAEPPAEEPSEDDSEENSEQEPEE